MVNSIVQKMCSNQTDHIKLFHGYVTILVTLYKLLSYLNERGRMSPIMTPDVTNNDAFFMIQYVFCASDLIMLSCVIMS